MKIPKLLVLGTLLVALCMGTSASAQLYHGASIQKQTASSKMPGQTLDSLIRVTHDDDYGDTISVDAAWDIVDPLGAATRVPTVGNLVIVAVSGNTTATVGGPLPVKIGPPGSTLSGLPGNPAVGRVTFAQNTYVIQPGDPDPLPDQGSVNVHDLCDAPGTLGCSPITNLLQYVAQTDITYPEPCIDVTKTVNCDVATVGATVTYHYCITNCSTLEMEITNIADSVVTDAVVAAAFMAAHANDDTLNPAEQVCFNVPYVIKVTDADPLINTVRVDAEDTTYHQTDYDTDDATVDIKYPCLLLEKSCTSLDPVQKGGVAFFRITLTNCGDLDLVVDVDEIDGGTQCDVIGLSVPAGGVPLTCDVEIDVPVDFTGTEFINHVTANWATIPALPCVTLIEDTENDEVPCEVTGGATRTPGFWKTHTTFAEHVLLNHCGGVLDLGFVQLDSIDEICAYFWANKANNTDGSKRTKLCQARMHAAFQAIAALLNNCVPSGGGIPVDLAEIATILGGTDIAAIQALASELGAYNESGDDVALIDPDGPPGSATPQECKAYDQTIADCESQPKPGKGPK